MWFDQYLNMKQKYESLKGGSAMIAWMGYTGTEELERESVEFGILGSKVFYRVWKVYLAPEIENVYQAIFKGAKPINITVDQARDAARRNMSEEEMLQRFGLQKPKAAKMYVETATDDLPWYGNY